MLVPEVSAWGRGDISMEYKTIWAARKCFAQLHQEHGPPKPSVSMDCSSLISKGTLDVVIIGTYQRVFGRITGLTFKGTMILWVSLMSEFVSGGLEAVARGV